MRCSNARFVILLFSQFSPSELKDKLEVYELWSGLRPGRDTIRLELDNSFAIPVVHNYGHGKCRVEP